MYQLYLACIFASQITKSYVAKGFKHATYTKTNAQFHWGVSDAWQLFDVKKDPSNLYDLANAHPELVDELKQAYSKWWDDQFPVMVKRGGDEGDPDANKRGKK